jgi:hypothetical protein
MTEYHASKDQLRLEQFDRYEERMGQFGDYNVALPGPSPGAWVERAPGLGRRNAGCGRLTLH